MGLFKDLFGFELFHSGSEGQRAITEKEIKERNAKAYAEYWKQKRAQKHGLV